jgi:hypothetical protein
VKRCFTRLLRFWLKGFGPTRQFHPSRIKRVEQRFDAGEAFFVEGRPGGALDEKAP